MRKEVYTEKGAPPAGIYSQGIVADGPVAYIAGQGPLDPATGKIGRGRVSGAGDARIQQFDDSAGGGRHFLGACDEGRCLFGRPKRLCRDE